MEQPALEFENASTWAASHRQLVDAVLVVTNSRGQIYISRPYFGSNEVVYTVKTFPIRSHKQYCVYKSNKTLLKLSANGRLSIHGVYGPLNDGDEL